jgi:hypothetical protein
MLRVIISPSATFSLKGTTILEKDKPPWETFQPELLVLLLLLGPLLPLLLLLLRQPLLTFLLRQVLLFLLWQTMPPLRR